MIFNFFECCTGRRKKDDFDDNNKEFEKVDFSYTSDSTAENNECFNLCKPKNKLIVYKRDFKNFYIYLVFH